MQHPGSRTLPANSRIAGRILVNPKGFGFLELEGRTPRAAFVPPRDFNPFLEGDRVEATITESAPGKLAASDLVLLERTRVEVFGSVTYRQGKPHLRIDRQVANTDWRFVQPGASPSSLRELLVEGDLVVAHVPAGSGEVVFVRKVAPADASLERVIVRYGLRKEYPAACLAEVTRSLGDGSTESRRDLRNLTTLTIDAPVSRDLDDALAVYPPTQDGALRVLVSIADVDSMVPKGSALDEEARRRGTSVYLAGCVIPMLPHALSEDALSLLPMVDRPALTVEFRIDPEGEVTAVDIERTLIRSHARLSYEQVEAFLDEHIIDDMSPEIVETLRLLRTAAARISAVRAARGGVSLLREEAHVTLDAQSREVTHIDARSSGSAHLLVERLMVAANEAVARWLVARGLPGMFRVHDAPEPDRVEMLGRFARSSGFEAAFGDRLTPRRLAAFEAQFAHTKLAPAMNTVLGRTLGPARYTVHPSQHFGLAAPLYLHFTSPIRRYADLVVHRIVKAFLAGDRQAKAEDPAIEELAVELNKVAFVASKAEQERLRMVAARHFATRIGERFEGTVIAVKTFGLVLQLRGLGITGTLGMDALVAGEVGADSNDTFRVELDRQQISTDSRTYVVGQTLAVTVAGSNEEQGRIDLALSAAS